MNADRLREIQAALLRDFAADCVTQSCPANPRADLIYSHVPAGVDATNLVPLTQTDIDARVDSWVWPTLQAYEQGAHQHLNPPYRDFISSRFVWKELAGVTIAGLPDAAAPSVTTAADGGAVAVFQPGANLGGQTVPVTITVPDGVAVTGYPSVRRVCLSTPGQPGNHADLADGVNECELAYPQATDARPLRLVSVMPSFTFELRREGQANEPITGDPWRERIGYGATPEARWRKFLWETSTETQIGQILRYGGRFYGIQNLGADTAVTVRANYADTLSASRRQVIAGVLGVEGGPSAVASHDGPKLSWGMNQWIIPPNAVGEFPQIVAYIYDFFPAAFDRCFGRYGLGVTFTGRSRTWSAGTYTNVALFRIPCCGPLPAPRQADVRLGLDAIRQTLGTPEATTGMHAALAAGFRLLGREETISCAMIYLFHKAGFDADVQRAQVEWTSYRISRAISRLTRPTNDEALAAFLVSLGSNIDAATRETKATASINLGRSEGHTYPAATERFDDTGTAVAWRDWPTRCDEAGKTTTPPA